MDKRIKANMVMSLALQIVTIVSGFIIPKQILLAFGSEVNGLVNSITQFLNYISLMEGGLGAVLMTALYKPLNEHDEKKINGIIVAGNHFFKKIAKIFLVYLIIVSVVYPIIVKTQFSFEYVCSLSLILGINLFVQYYFSIIWRLMLQADRKVFVSAGVQIIVIIINTILTIITIKIYPSVHFVKLISSLAFVLQPMIYNAYITKYYFINLKAIEDSSALKHRWDGFGINLAAFLNGNTDVMVLTLLSSLANVSIYGVYSLVVLGIKSVITAISAGITPSLGREYSLGHKQNLKSIFLKYENLIFFTTFSIYSCAIILIVPFVLNYTVGINDTNYRQPVFSILLIFSYGIFCLREPYVNMAYVSNAYKKISKFAYIEAVINVVLSFTFVHRYGLNGVALGTLCSMSFRTIVQVLYLWKNVLFRNPVIFILKFILFTLSSGSGIFLAQHFVTLSGEVSWGEWLLKAILSSTIIFLINILVGILIIKWESKVKKA